MIGFTTPRETGKKNCQEFPEANVLTFDSGAGLTCDDARHHILITGTTGAGKTESGLLPCAYGFIRQGCHGLIVDVKGNLRGKIRIWKTWFSTYVPTPKALISQHLRALEVINYMSSAGKILLFPGFRKACAEDY